MVEYEEFDAKLLARIKKSSATFSSLSTHMMPEASRIAGFDHRGYPKDHWRVTDRRLQSLRKRGLIEYSTKTGWSAKTKKEDQCNASSVADR